MPNSKPQPDAKSDNKPDNKLDNKPDAKSDNKPDAKPDRKPDAKPDRKPDTQPDVNGDFLRAAAEVMVALDSRYLESDLDTQIELRDQLDRAMQNYALTRLAILKRNAVCTPADVAKMQALRASLANATRLRQLLDTALNFAGFLATRFL
jgi:hypothetical protein